MRNLQNFTLKIFARAVVFFIIQILITQGIYPRDKISSAVGELNFKQKSEFVFSEKPVSIGDINLNTPLQNCWSFPVFNKTINNFASDNEQKLLLSFLNGEIISISSESGELFWKTDLGGKIISEILKDSQNLYIVSANYPNNSSDTNADKNFNTKNQLKIRSLVKTTGLTNWEVKLPISTTSEKAYLLEYSDEIILFENQGGLYRINKTDGRIIWHVELDIELSTIPSIISDSIVIGTQNKQIVLYSLSEKKEIGRIKVSSAPTVFFTNTGDRSFILGDEKGLLISFRRTNNSKKLFEKNWNFRNGGEISRIVDAGEGFLITSYDNFAYLISKNKGELIWKRRFSGRIAFQPLISGRHAVINVIGETSAFVIEIASGKIVNKISIENDNFFIASPLKTSDKIVFPTNKGLFAFSETGNGCPNRTSIEGK